jgi:hemolysin III
VSGAAGPVAGQAPGVGAETHVHRLLDDALGTLDRPTWRGRSHLIAVVVVVPLLVVMAILAPGARDRAAVIVYAVGLCSMLVASTTYHRWVHTMQWRRIWRRADHAAIFIAIAGTFTPLCLALFSTPAAIVTLLLVWAAAITGATINGVGWRRGDPIAAGMYIANGWAGLALLPALLGAGLVVPLVLLGVGGLVYTLGALGFSRGWPRLRPGVFSYHEVWHLCTLGAAGLHLATIWMVAT